MALRRIVLKGDEILTKKCKPVKEITPRVIELMNDMVETMAENDGVGLAAPQVGVMKRLFVARPFPDAEDPEMDKIYFMINPEILDTRGEQESTEGCLSYPDFMGYVDRPQAIKIKAQDLDGEWHTYEFEDYAAVVMCHENDHLDGILYTDKAKEIITVDEFTERIEAERAAMEDDLAEEEDKQE